MSPKRGVESAGEEPDSPIEAYLDELVTGMSTRQPRALRHLLAEAEAHLRDDAAVAVGAGRSPLDAEADAVRRFGPAADLVAAEDRRLGPTLPVIARQFATTALLLGAIGGIAVGVSGVLAEIVRLAGGARAVIDVQPGQTLSASDCARWLALDPTARSCHDAAIADWVGEVVGYRLVVGLLGMCALVVFALLRRRSITRERLALLPAAVSDVIAAVVFAAAGVWTLGMGVDTLVVGSGGGSGQWFSAAPVALAAAAVFGVRLVRDLRQGPVEPAVTAI